VPAALPNVFTIPPGEAFVDVLVRGMAQRLGDDPMVLSRALVLVPTRRGVRALREAFLRQHAGRPMLLPTIRPIGDVDADELDLSVGDAADMLDLPPAIPELRRQLLLAEAIKRHRGDITPPQAVLLARELAQLLDQLQTEDVSLDAFTGLVPDDYAAHWQTILDFLQVLQAPWQAILAVEGAIDPADRRNRLLRALAARWRETPPDRPVIAAGSTGSIPATADLLSSVAALPHGAVILPGLDQTSDDIAWQEIDPAHAQFGMRHLLQVIGIDRRDVGPWDETATTSPRAPLVREALRPAPTTEAWRDIDAVDAGALEGLRRIDCEGPHEEAATIALLMRETLETPRRTAALITPDRALARRVTAELQRWQIEVDDSAGTPLSATPVGALLRLSADMLAQELEPVALLAALKHPLAKAGRPAGRFIPLIRELDRRVLRGPRPAPGFAGLKAAMAATEKLDPALTALIEEVEAAASEVSAAFADAARPLPDLVRAHVGFAEWLTRNDDGDCQLWQGDAGDSAAGFIAELLDAGDGLGAVAPAGYPAVLTILMESRVVRPAYGRHPRLNIWGPLEARLQQADLLILGGLNEGTWPAQVDAGAWLSRPMRQRLGLMPPERRIGLAAHDFAQALTAADVVLTRAAKVDGTPTVPSRWLLRLDQVLAAAGTAIDNTTATAWRTWQGALDAAGVPQPAPPPAARPPVKARPRQLSVTRVETWLRDPYAIYARYILGLKALDPLAADAGAAERGTAVHDALDRFVDAFPDALPPDAYAQLLAFGQAAFAPWLDRPGVRAFWWPRFLRIADWFIATERSRRPHDRPLKTEVDGTLVFTGPAGPFTLTAKADRIDRLADGSLAIIDYKTGQPPRKTELERGEAPQLPLEAAIAATGGFDGIPASGVGLLSFWRLNGGRVPGEIADIPIDASELAEMAQAQLAELIATFDKAETPYRSRPRPAAAPRFSDYDHLARVKEWTAGGPGDV